MVLKTSKSGVWILWLSTVQKPWVQFLIYVFLISIIPVTVHNEPLFSSFQALNFGFQLQLLGKDFSVCEMGKEESM